MSQTIRQESKRSAPRLLLLDIPLLAILGWLLAPAAAAQPLTFTRLAGNVGGPGVEDGTGSEARFYGSWGVAVDGVGNVYVADTGNHVIRKVSPAGAVTTLAGLAGSPGSTDGAGSTARFYAPNGIAVDASGNVYVADTGNHTIRKVTPTGRVTTLAGLVGAQGNVDGTGSAALFVSPVGLAVDASGSLFVASVAHTVRRVTAAGVVTTVAGLAYQTGSADGTGSAARFRRPGGVAVDAAGNLYVADTGNHTIRKVGAGGQVTTIAGLAGWPGGADGTGTAAGFNAPEGVAVDGSGNVYVGDPFNRRIRKVTPAGVVTTFAGGYQAGSADGTATDSRFAWPTGVAVDQDGNVFVADRDNWAIRKVTASGVVTTVAGLATPPGWVDGTGSVARFGEPSSVAVDGAGSVYVADSRNNVIRKATAAGSVTTLAGLPLSFGSEDGTGSAARFNGPSGVAVEASGNVYVADTGNHTIRKVTATGEVTTVAGLANSPGSEDGTGSAARFAGPYGIGLDPAGNLIVAEAFNHTIRKVTPAGVVTTLAGLAGAPGSVDAIGSAARFGYPRGVVVDAAGNVYVADSLNHTIRKVTAGGEVTTLAGQAGAPCGLSDGTAAAARFCEPFGVSVDAAGDLYVADSGNRSLRRVTSAGNVTTVAGLPMWSIGANPEGLEGTGGAERFDSPRGVAVGPGDVVHVVDSSSHAIRKSASGLADAAVIDQPTAPVAETRQLSTSPQTATAWRWTQVRIPAGSTATLSSTSVRDPVFTPDVSGYYVFRLEAGDGTGTSITEVGLEAVGSTATVSGDGTICRGESAAIQAALTGAAPWTVTWSDGVVQSGVSTSPATRSVSPTVTTTFTVASISNVHGEGKPGGSATVTVKPLPSGVIEAPGTVAPGQVGVLASVPDGGPGATYDWDLSDGTITDGAGTRQVTWTAGGAGWAVVSVTVTADGCAGVGARTVRVGGADPALPLTFTHLAGSTGGSDSVDGTGTAARFVSPAGLAVDAAGNVYISDSYSGTIRRVTPSGAVTTLAGLAGSSGSTDGTGSTARFLQPYGVAVDVSGNVYVADTGSHTVRKVTPAGVVATMAGLAGASGGVDSIGSAARFRYPRGAAVDAAGSVYVADSENHTIRKVSAGGEVTTLAGLAGSPGSADGTGSAARFKYPHGVAVDASGNVYVADSFNRTVRKMTPAGVVTTLAGLAGAAGSADGTGSAARFHLPRGVAVDGSGDLYVSDGDQHTIRKVTAAGAVTTLAGLAGAWGSTDGAGSAARFGGPAGVGVGPAGHVYVADSGNHTIRKVAAGVVTTLAGLAATPGSEDGTGEAARFDSPSGVAADASGTLYVADRSNHTIRKVSPSGAVTTLAGRAGGGGSADGTGSLAQFLGPSDVAVDAAGNLYVADSVNSVIRKVTAAGVVTTLAGLAGSSGSADGTGSGARFYVPEGLAVDASGNVYVADTLNSVLRKVTSAGVVTTLAGLAGSSGSADGVGSVARFWHPKGIAADAVGNVYVADTSNHTIRLVTPSGEVSTLAGLAGAEDVADGTGSAARFSYPNGLAVDAAGSVFVADTYNSSIRMVTPAGEVTTVGGGGGTYGCADGTGSAARFASPADVAVGLGGEVFVAETSNQVIRKGTPTLADVAVIDQASGPVGQARQLDTSNRTATSWVWTQTRIPTGSAAALTSTSIPNPTFTPDVAGFYVFRLTATNGTATSVTELTLDAVPAPSAAVSGGGAICAGGSATVQAALTGTPPWSVTWSDGVTLADVTASPLTRAVAPAATTVYAVTAVSDATGPGSSSGSATVTVNPVPAPPVITAPSSALSGTPDLVASVEPHAGSIYVWTIVNGTITDGQGTSTVTFSAGGTGQLTLGVVETAGGCDSAPGTTGIAVTAATSKAHVFTPCRVVDTRDPAGTFGGPALGRLQERSWPIAAGACGVPGTARALALNVTVVVPQAGGYVTLWPSDAPRPLTSTINFTPGQVRANNAVVRVAADGQASLSAFNGSDGDVHVLVDVTGYFE